ncbi:MAG: hypothetical protein U1F61_09955 [Opitutaceae bacterium]
MNTQSIVNRTRARCSALIGAGLLAASLASGLRAAEGTWSGSSEVTVVSDYLWRGFKLADASLQPSLSLVYSDKFTLGVWGSYALEDGDNGKYNETDLIASYSLSQKYYTASIGGTVYRADNLRDPNTGAPFDSYFESYLSVTFKHKLSPTITFWREFGRLSTNYIEFSINPSWNLNEKSRVSLRPYVGFFENSNDYYGVDIAAYYDFDKNFYGKASVTLIKSSFADERASAGLSVGYHW